MLGQLRKWVGLPKRPRAARTPSLAPSRAPARRAIDRLALRLECLEGREVPATLFVGTAYTQGSTTPQSLGNVPQGGTFTVPVSLQVTETA
ncbi:MAG: hypothetical protein K2V38_15215, partial [Gemmataceae bacterium]|nr:hypothetical protein [Gemmataceae bacterium]